MGIIIIIIENYHILDHMKAYGNRDFNGKAWFPVTFLYFLFRKEVVLGSDPVSSWLFNQPTSSRR